MIIICALKSKYCIARNGPALKENDGTFQHTTMYMIGDA